MYLPHYNLSIAYSINPHWIFKSILGLSRAYFRIEADFYLHHLIEVGLYTQNDNKNENHYQYMYNEALNHFLSLKEESIVINKRSSTLVTNLNIEVSNFFHIRTYVL